MTVPQPAAEPDGAPRIASLDILRGVAILGILFMNINSMGAPIVAAHSVLPSLTGWTPTDRVAWGLREVFASGTARCLLEMLFGAGMVILTGRIAAGRSGWGATLRYYWRMAVLALFGLAHVWLLLWPGDILHIYALSAMIAFPLRRLPAGWLIALGLTYSAYSTTMAAIPLTRAINGNALAGEARVARAAGRPVTPAQKKAEEGLGRWHKQVEGMRSGARKEIAERRGGVAGWRAVLTGEWVRRYTNWQTPLFMYWEAVATILIGAALFKLGILQGARSRRFYARVAAAGYAVGLPIRATAMLFTARMDDTITYAWAADEVGRLATTIGHLGLIHWLLMGGVGARLLRPFAAAGRTALTLYVLQSIVCLWLLYPPFALDLFARQGWAALMLTALAVDAALLVLANWYAPRFTIAPVEWAWRSLAAGRRLPFARRDRSVEDPPGMDLGRPASRLHRVPGGA